MEFKKSPKMTEEQKTAWQLKKLQKKKVLDSIEYEKPDFEALLNRINSIFKGPAKSTITPDEARIISAATAIYRPKTVVGIGTYFGYGMSWIVRNMTHGGMAYLIDPDTEVCEMCRDNFQEFGFPERIKILPENFEDVWQDLPDEIDLVWIDPMDPILRKKIYGPIIKTIFPKIKSGGLVIAHNVKNRLPFERFNRKNGDFKPFLNRNFRFKCYIDSKNGLAFAKK